MEEIISRKHLIFLQNVLHFDRTKEVTKPIVKSLKAKLQNVVDKKEDGHKLRS